MRRFRIMIPSRDSMVVDDGLTSGNKPFMKTVIRKTIMCLISFNPPLGCRLQLGTGNLYMKLGLGLHNLLGRYRVRQ